MPLCKCKRDQRRVAKSGRVQPYCGGCAREISRRYRTDQTGKYATNDLRSNLLYAARTRAKRKGLVCTITKDDLTIPERCPVFGFKFERGSRRSHERTPTIDRIDPFRGYEPGNIVIVSWRANNLKRDATIEELQALAAFYGAP